MLRGATSENRLVLKIGVSAVYAKFLLEGDVPTNMIFAPIDRPMKALITFSLTCFTQRNFVADFLQAKCGFRWKTADLRF